jgi:ribosomal protein L20
MNADSYAGRTASLRDAQVRQKQVGLDINQLRQINEDIMKSSMHLQERNQLLERTNQALEQKVAEYERLLDSLKTENIALKKQILEQMKLKQA